MFEAVLDADLIDVMGESTRDESTAIAQRLAAVGELYVRQEQERAECKWWSIGERVDRRLRCSRAFPDMFFSNSLSASGDYAPGCGP